MTLDELRQKISNRSARLGVIGLGYVGLPVAALFADAGFNVVGVEIQEARVEKINHGESPIEGEEPNLAELLEAVSGSKRLRATTQYSNLRDRDVILIDVETPVDETHTPRYTALRSALSSLAKVLKEGALVIVESTIAPGTMQKVVLPLLEQGTGRQVNQGFYLGNCPERVMPGKLIRNLRMVSRVVGGGTPETAEVMAQLYRCVMQADLDLTDWITAELVKTVENAYRDVQIAFANEVALICEVVGGDAWKVRELVNKTPYRNMHLPGAGVGGHCIPKDPWLLAYGVQGEQVSLRLIPAARSINDGMPGHMLELVCRAVSRAGGEMRGARILVLGYAYLENSDDTRNSPSQVLVQGLQELGAQSVIHDPFVGGFQGDVFALAKDCDAVVAMVRHHVYLQLDLVALKTAVRRPILVDGRRVFNAEEARLAGWDYSCVGVA